MIQQFVDIWEAHKETLREKYTKNCPNKYREIVQDVVDMLHEHTSDQCQKVSKKVHEIDDGEFQGTLVFIIPNDGYQPSTYWYFKQSYGSCSGCDTLESIKMDCGWEEDGKTKPEEKQTLELMTLALHVIQGLKEM